jgi:hypothetical protein
MLFYRRLLPVGIAVPLVSLVLNACGGGDVTAPPATSGTLQVTTATSGPEPDPDGYSIQVDGGTATAIGNAETRTFTDLGSGDHTVQLGGLAANCTATDGNSRSVTVSAGGTANLTFTITCAGTSGSIKVTTVTTGTSLDADGYSLALDTNAPQRISVNTSITLPNVAAGNHSVGLTGVASNCTVAEANPRPVGVTADAQASVTFTVTCTPSGIQWTLIPFPSDFTGAGLWASSASDLFVAGRSTQSRTVLHYNGHDWVRQPLPPGDGNAIAVWGSSPSDVYAVGSTIIWHYGGAQWVTAFDDNGQTFYVGLAGTSAQDVFAAGILETATGSKGFITHWDGDTWDLPSSPIGEDGEAFDVWATSPGDAWAVGRQYAPFDVPPGDPDVRYQIVHYNGTEWSLSFDFYALSTVPTGFRGVWASAANDVFVVGPGGGIWHYNGTDWSPMTSPTTEDLFDLWGSSGSDVFAVGDAGILRFDGTSWSVINPTKGTRVWGAGRDVFVLVQGGILHGTR